MTTIPTPTEIHHASTAQIIPMLTNPTTPLFIHPLFENWINDPRANASYKEIKQAQRHFQSAMPSTINRNTIENYYLNPRLPKIKEYFLAIYCFTGQLHFPDLYEVYYKCGLQEEFLSNKFNITNDAIKSHWGNEILSSVLQYNDCSKGYIYKAAWGLGRYDLFLKEVEIDGSSDDKSRENELVELLFGNGKGFVKDLYDELNYKGLKRYIEPGDVVFNRGLKIWLKITKMKMIIAFLSVTERIKISKICNLFEIEMDELVKFITLWDLPFVVIGESSNAIIQYNQIDQDWSGETQRIIRRNIASGEATIVANLVENIFD